MPMGWRHNTFFTNLTHTTTPSHPPALGELLAPTKAPNGCLLEGRQDLMGVHVFLEKLLCVAGQVLLLSKFRICHKQFALLQ